MATKLIEFDYRNLQQYREWINDPETARLLGRWDYQRPVTVAEHWKWYRRMLDCSLKGQARLFAIESNGAYVGNTWLWNIDEQDSKAEIRIVIGDTRRQNRGVGTRALELLTEYATTRQLGRLYAYVFAYNSRAVRLFEKAGFVLEGTLKRDRKVGGKWEDVHIMAITKGG